jgi:hypothetical protein
MARNVDLNCAHFRNLSERIHLSPPEVVLFLLRRATVHWEFFLRKLTALSKEKRRKSAFRAHRMTSLTLPRNHRSETILVPWVTNRRNIFGAIDQEKLPLIDVRNCSLLS